MGLNSLPASSHSATDSSAVSSWLVIFVTGISNRSLIQGPVRSELLNSQDWVRLSAARAGQPKLRTKELQRQRHKKYQIFSNKIFLFFRMTLVFCKACFCSGEVSNASVFVNDVSICCPLGQTLVAESFNILHFLSMTSIADEVCDYMKSKANVILSSYFKSLRLPPALHPLILHMTPWSHTSHQCNDYKHGKTSSVLKQELLIADNGLAVV